MDTQPASRGNLMDAFDAAYEVIRTTAHNEVFDAGLCEAAIVQHVQPVWDHLSQSYPLELVKEMLEVAISTSLFAACVPPLSKMMHIHAYRSRPTCQACLAGSI
jgi:hypothetical protein